MVKRGIIIFVLLFSLAFNILGYCKNPDEEKQIKRINGIVAEIDWVGDKISVRTMYFGNIDEITFVVNSGTKITKGTATIGFLELKVADQVAVEYFNNCFAGLEAESIMVIQK